MTARPRRPRTSRNDRSSPRRPPRSLGSPPAWVADAVFYQIFPDRFARSSANPALSHLEPWDAPPTRNGFKGGDLFGITERLGELEELGINALYLNPIFASASNHRYHTYDYYRVDPLLGGDRAFRELIDAAHARNIRVVLDGVFNHCGRGFWPFHHVLEAGEASPYRDWFHVDSLPLRAYDGEPTGYRAWWGLPALPKLNVAHPDAREHLLGAAEHWTRFGVDGWRLDVPEEIEDPTFWPEFRRRVRSIRRDAYLVGEIWNAAPEWLGDRFDGVMNYPLARLLLGYCAQRVTATPADFGGPVPLRHAKSARVELRRLMDSCPAGFTGAQLNLLSSHDTPRFRTAANGDRRALWLATAIQMTLPGAPCVYYGDEIGLEGGPDPDSRRAYPRDGDSIDSETQRVVRELIALRRQRRALRHGSLEWAHGPSSVLSYIRCGGGTRILVAINSTGRAQTGEWRSRKLAPASRRSPRVLWTTPPTSDARASDATVRFTGRGIAATLGPRSATLIDLPAD